MTTAEVIYQLVQTLPDDEASQVLSFVEQLCQQFPSPPSDNTQPLSTYFGILKDSPNFSADPVVIQQRMRSEWD